jgi:hypothetical protein
MSVIIVTTYYFVRTSEGIKITNTEIEKTQTELLLEENINNKYPSTPKEVLELYIKISKSLYDKNTTEEQIDKLATQMLLLFDEELLKKNPPEFYKMNLKSEINGFRDKNIDVMNYLAGDNDEAEFWAKENKEYASRIVTYTLKEGNNYTKVYNTFILRRDDSGKWKILGWSSKNSPELDNTKK